MILVVATLAIFLIWNSSVTRHRDQQVARKREVLAVIVALGDNIHEAGELLEDRGFRIGYGP